MILRPAKPDDVLAVARVHVRSWQAGYRTLLPEDYLDRLRPEDRAARYNFSSVDPHQPKTIVAEPAVAGQVDPICGFVTIAPARDTDVPGHAEICALYVDPDCWGRGVGAALISAARDHLVSLGFRHAVLWMLRDNTRADRFYRIDGWTPDGARRTESLWGVTVDSIRYRRPLQSQ